MDRLNNAVQSPSWRCFGSVVWPEVSGGFRVEECMEGELKMVTSGNWHKEFVMERRDRRLTRGDER